MLKIGNFLKISTESETFLIERFFWQVVYLSDANGYIPLNSLRGPAPPIPPQLYAGSDLEAWRPELWDRDYNRRYRFNNTRVQREISFSSRLNSTLKLYLKIDIEAECQDDYMKIRIGFNGSFTGLLYSAGESM